MVIVAPSEHTSPLTADLWSQYDLALMGPTGGTMGLSCHLAVAYSCWVQLARQQILHKLPVQGFCSLPCWVSACATH